MYYVKLLLVKNIANLGEKRKCLGIIVAKGCLGGFANTPVVLLLTFDLLLKAPPD